MRVGSRVVRLGSLGASGRRPYIDHRLRVLSLFILHGVCVIAILVSAVVCWTQTSPAPKTRITAPMRPLIEALADAGASGSLELQGHWDGGPRWHFPNLRPPTTSGSSLLQVVREMFADDPAMQVTQDQDGTVRMIENGVQADLLNVRISHIWFASNGVPLQYAAFSPNSALMQVLQSPEVEAFMKAHDMELGFRGEVFLGNQTHSPDLPHIAESMDDVTVSQALDRILETFPGIWFYEHLSRRGEKGEFVFLKFFNLHDPGLVEEDPVKE